MARPKNLDQERGYLRSAWDEVQIMEADFGCVLVLNYHRTPRPGVWRFIVSATPPPGQFIYDPSTAHSVSFDYPTAKEQPFTAALWDHLRHLHQMLYDSKRLQEPRPPEA